MDVIHYFNHTSQVFDAAANIFTLTSTESANTLRNLSAARHTHATHLWRIASMKNENHSTGKKFMEWPFNISYPRPLTNEADVSTAILSLEEIIQAEIALNSSKVTTVWIEQESFVEAVKNASVVMANIIKMIIERVYEQPKTTFVCQNCFFSQKDIIPNLCPLCGVGENWFKPYSRF